MIDSGNILKLTKQLLPTGRAWKISGEFEQLFKALGESEARAFNFAVSTLDRILADNDNFTNADALAWEKRLKLPVNPEYSSLSSRKAIILRKYQFPGEYLNRQNYKYLEVQLQLAGFEVTVIENFDADTSIGETFQHRLDSEMGMDTEMGVVANYLGDSFQHSLYDTEMGMDTEMGSNTLDIIANSPFYGEPFEVDSKLNCFKITGIVSPNFVTAFRMLVLQLKPVHTAALLDIQYVQSGDLAFVSGNNMYTVDDRNLVTMNYV